MRKVFIISIASMLLCGCGQEYYNAKETQKSVEQVVVEDNEVENKVLYTGGSIDVKSGLEEVENIHSSYRYTDEEFINTDEVPDSLRLPLQNELPAVQTALLSVVYKYCNTLGINYELLHWKSPISAQCDNHNVYLLDGVSSTIRIHVACSERVIACIE